MSQTERVLRIQEMLLDRTSVSRQTFLEELEVSPAQFKRDLSFLRDRFNLKITYDPQKRGYVLPKNDDEAEIALPGPMYTAREIYALLTMQNLVEQLQSGLLDEHLGPLRERLKSLLGREDLRSEEIRRRIRILHMASRPVASKTFSRVSEATLARRRLHIRYFTRAENRYTERDVSPQRLVFYRGNWYLDAYCHLRVGLRSFAVDAIEKVKMLDEEAMEVKTAALDSHLGSGYGIFSGPASEKAVLRFAPEAARFVAAEIWHPKQETEWQDGGDLVLTVPYSNERELLMDVLRYGADVEVLSPPSLRTQMRLRLREALEKYQKINF